MQDNWQPVTEEIIDGLYDLYCQWCEMTPEARDYMVAQKKWEDEVAALKARGGPEHTAWQKAIEEWQALNERLSDELGERRREGHVAFNDQQKALVDAAMAKINATYAVWAKCLPPRPIEPERMLQPQFGMPMQNQQLPLPSIAVPLVKSAADLQHKTFAPVQYVVPGYIAEGCTILAGKPKVGKSWIMLDVGLAVASGGQTLGATAQQGDVLCLMLEDNERRLKDRIKKIVGPFAAWPQRFTFATEWPRSDEGLAAIRSWLKTAQTPRLIVVDVLARFRAPVGSQNAYEADYAAIAGLQAIASEYRIAVVVIHHLRKSAADSDPFDKVSGTLGLSGAADSVLILDRDGQGTTLYGRGRDIEEIETAVEFDRASCRWRVLGAAPDVRRSDERKQIIDALKESGGSLTRSEIIAATGMQPNAADQLLYKMGRAGEVRKVGRGVYHVVTGPSQQIIPPPPC